MSSETTSSKKKIGPRHGILSQAYSRRVFVILAVLIVAALTVRWALVPKSFGKDGHYRSLAPLEEMARKPLLQGKKVCAKCHAKQFAKHENGIHVHVQCEDCHGNGSAHVKAREAGADPSQGHMFRKLMQANCLACHRRLAARPKLFPTINVQEHFRKVRVKNQATRCQECHNPHQPLFLDRPLSQARIHPLIHPCSDCHKEKNIAEKPLPKGHVVTFQCKDCHAAIVVDFKKKPHAQFGCRTCHQFHKDSDFSGRIIKNGNPRFCLMCHLDRPFKDGTRIPLLKSFSAHLDDVAEDKSDRAKRCVDCHLDDAIHRVKWKTTGIVSTPKDIVSTPKDVE